MLKLKAHFDGQQVVLDEPAPPELKPNTPVEVVVTDAREKALAERQAFLKEWWSRPPPPGVKLNARSWTREELYERGSKHLS